MIVRGLLAALPVIGALAGLSWAVVHAERSGARGDATRLALWRLESRASALVLAAVMQELPRATASPLQVAAVAEPRARKTPAATIAEAVRAASGVGKESLNSRDFAQRQSNVEVAQQAVLAEADPIVRGFTVQWDGERLIGEISLTNGPSHRTPIAWDDWRSVLLADIADVLPAARLRQTAPGDELLLASLPVSLDPGTLVLPLSATTRWLLLVTWVAGLGGLLAVLAAMAASARLAERRAAFVSAVTHELRTPLTALRLHGDLLADPRVADDPARRAGPVAAVQQGATRLAHLIDNVLDYARLERRRSPSRRAVPLAELLPTLVDRLPEVRIPPLPDLTVLADPHGTERILANLADNARKYGRAPFTFTVLRFARRAQLILSDAGPGLTREARAHLFSPFARSAEAAAGEAPGVGLGLALCRRLARAQGGDLQLDDAPGGGVRAVLTLRIAE